MARRSLLGDLRFSVCTNNVWNMIKLKSGEDILSVLAAANAHDCD
jgi:hypothetical protein